MRFTTQLISSLVLASFGVAAMAQEAVQDSTWITPSTMSRADVKSETLSAVRSGNLPRGDAPYDFAQAPKSSMSRAQVHAEAKEAMRLGLVQFGEAPVRAATAADLEQIRSAGLRAINADTQVAGK